MRFFTRIFLFIRVQRERIGILVGLWVGILILIIGIGLGVNHIVNATTVDILPDSSSVLFQREQKIKSKKETSEKSLLVGARRLDGMIVSLADTNYRPVCVMIDNAAFGNARPQAGLSRALVVYDVIVEGGITRNMAIFAGEQSEMIGPLRSARDTFLDIASEYNCMYTHAGGSPTALAHIREYGIRDNDMLHEPKYAWRDYHRPAPHNLFTSTMRLEDALFHWAKESEPDYRSWSFKDPSVEKPKDSTTTLDIVFGGSYTVTYHYDAEHHVYERSVGGVRQYDAWNNEPIVTTNVIIQHVEEGIPVAGYGRINWPVIGEGAVDIYHEGGVEHGTWQKTERTDRTRFVDVHGEDISLTRGNTWIAIVPPHIVIETHDEELP